MKTPRAATAHDDYQRVEPGSPHPSARLSHDTSSGIRGWHVLYAGIYHCMCGRVSSNLTTVEATKFVEPHKSHVRQYIINACSIGPNRCGL
jgi:hypothetical protein